MNLTEFQAKTEEEFEEKFYGRGYHWSKLYQSEVAGVGRHKCNEKCRPHFYVKPSRENVTQFYSTKLRELAELLRKDKIKIAKAGPLRAVRIWDEEKEK